MAATSTRIWTQLPDSATPSIGVAGSSPENRYEWQDFQAAFATSSGSAAGVGAPTATAVSGAATLNATYGQVTSEALSTATSYTLTLTDSFILAASLVEFWATTSTGATTGVQVASVTPAAGSVVAVFAMASLTGTLKIGFRVYN